MKVLFICRGNVGRSQMAEFIFNKLAPTGFVAKSAGTKVFNEKGESMEGQILADLSGAANVVAALRELDLEASQAQRTSLTEVMVNEADVLVVMAEKDTWPSYLLGKEGIHYWEMSDPKQKSLEETRLLRDHITDLVKKLISEIA